ncbi:MAG: hypothetical protein IJS81_04850 [Selenomonadaceae bacterium]|nr:hypothetical protein [Selenomonadaceae bacterium]
MNKLLKLIASIFLVAAFCLSFTADNSADAASNKTTKTTAQDKKAIQAFRQSIIATANDNRQVVHQFFIFMLPNFQGELEFNGKITPNTLDVAGNLGLWMTGDNGLITDSDFPFYFRMNGNNVEVYYKTDEQWKKYVTSSSAAANFADVFKAPTREDIDKELSTVREVKILQENDARRTLLVHMDGAKLADNLKILEMANSDPKATPEEIAFQKRIFGYIDTGLRNSDLWYTWRVDKKNNKTGVIIFDLSPVIQETALAVLDDPQNNDLPDEFKEILETLAFYSEFKAYATFLGPEAQASLDIPQEVIDTAKLVEKVKVSDLPSTDSPAEVTVATE